jgi:uncharacterized protein YecT (DUF1311 family)
MMRTLFALAIIIVAGLPSAAHAIDCARATSSTEHMICDDPKLMRADAAMGRAYSAILKAAPDPEIHAMLVASQKRWIAARDKSFGELDKATDGRTGEGYSKAMQRRPVLQATEDRARDLGNLYKGTKQAALIHMALQQRAFLAKFTGGAFAGFSTSCEFLPRNGGDPLYDYGCFGTAQYQNHDRICGQRQDWATYRVYTSRFVADVVAGEPKTIATCKNDSCFDDHTPDGRAGWDTRPATGRDGPLRGALQKLDAEGGDDEVDAPWLNACLTDEHFPQTDSGK